MRLLLLKSVIAVFLLISAQSHAQSIQEVKCEMSLEQVLLAQPFDIDHPKSEFAKMYTEQLFKDLSLLYKAYSQDQPTDIKKYISSIEDLIRKSDDLGMNVSMFSADIKFIQSLK